MFYNLPEGSNWVHWNHRPILTKQKLNVTKTKFLQFLIVWQWQVWCCWLMQHWSSQGTTTTLIRAFQVWNEQHKQQCQQDQRPKLCHLSKRWCRLSRKWSNARCQGQTISVDKKCQIRNDDNNVNATSMTSEKSTHRHFCRCYAAECFLLLA